MSDDVLTRLAAITARLDVLERSHAACVRVVGATTDRLEEGNEARRREIVELRRELTAEVNDVRVVLREVREQAERAARRW